MALIIVESLFDFDDVFLCNIFFTLFIMIGLFHPFV